MLLHHRFIETAKSLKEKTAFIDCFAERELSYGKTLIASLILARRFTSLKDSFLGIMLPTSLGAGLSVIASLMAGKVPVMINYSTGAEQNARYAQRKCDFRSIITSKRLLEKVRCPEIPGMIFLEDLMNSIGKLEKLRAASVASLPVPLIKSLTARSEEDDDAVILFTSGSEKDPKAVELTHRNILSNIESFSETIELSEQDRMLAILPYFHVFGLTVTLWAPLYHGMTIITYPTPLEYKRIVEIIRERSPSILVGTPAFLNGYLRMSSPGDFQSIRIAVTGADKCPDALRETFKKKHGIELLEGYGTTETSPVISVNRPEANKPGSVGLPIPGVEVRIEDYETGQSCPPGKVGRILVKGPNVMKGYLDDLEETSMRIRQGWYDTGDMGYLDEDGFLWHAGRLKRFVKIGGEMVSLVRVEDVLQRLLPEGVECCVVDVPDAKKGARIIAAITREINEKKVLKEMSKELPNIALPREFLVIEDLPKMGSGKIDFRKCAELVQEKLLA
ncbi:MAG: bifunctional acyl-ACP--phospholipid O-acyltransferase/long-chain-fatty-acid--ACP ligase [Nitrospirae bacterium]|nr:MAG: bifunctional acyl-ACP--phospholipid O-acyltransferase/long-chain-fatty-acid--ACP ligase [Nitrospirota bacterium]